MILNWPTGQVRVDHGALGENWVTFLANVSECCGVIHEVCDAVDRVCPSGRCGDCS